MLQNIRWVSGVWDEWIMQGRIVSIKMLSEDQSDISLMSAAQSQHNSLHLSTEVKDGELTWESPVCSLDSPEDLSAASLLNPADSWDSGPELSDGCWTSELRPEQNSWSLSSCSSPVWIKKTWCNFRKQCSCLK